MWVHVNLSSLLLQITTAKTQNIMPIWIVMIFGETYGNITALLMISGVSRIIKMPIDRLSLEQ